MLKLCDSQEHTVLAQEHSCQVAIRDLGSRGLSVGSQSQQPPDDACLLHVFWVFSWISCVQEKTCVVS